MSYGQAMKQRVLDLYDQGHKTKAISERLCVSRSWCRRVKQRRHEPPRRVGGSQPKLDAQGQARLAGFIAERPDSTLEELRRRIAQELQLTLSIGALWNTLRRMQFTLKKRA